MTDVLSSRQFFGAQKHLDHRGIFLLFLFLSVLVRSADEFFKQRMQLQRLRLEFGMELASQEKRMARDLNHLYISAIGSRPRDAQPCRHHGLFILTVEFVTMTVSFADLGLTVDSVRKRSRFDFARPRAQPHGATKLFHS